MAVIHIASKDEFTRFMGSDVALVGMRLRSITVL